MLVHTWFVSLYDHIQWLFYQINLIPVYYSQVNLLPHSTLRPMLVCHTSPSAALRSSNWLFLNLKWGSCWVCKNKQRQSLRKYYVISLCVFDCCIVFDMMWCRVFTNVTVLCSFQSYHSGISFKYTSLRCDFGENFPRSIRLNSIFAQTGPAAPTVW